MVVAASNYKNIDYTSEQLGTSHNDIRYMDLSAKRKYSAAKQESVIDTAVWKSLNSGGVPAVAYSFAEKLNYETGVPVGFITSSYAGTYISQWLPNMGLDSLNKNNNLYNTEIYPFRDMQLSGIIWYQGESDHRKTETYKERLKTLIPLYRELFANEDDVPFYYVQIARWNGSIDPEDPTASDPALMAEVRAIQSEVYLELKDTEDNFGIIPTLDLYGSKDNKATTNNSKWGPSGARYSIHPGQKTVIAERAVNWVLKDIYNKTTHKDGTAIYTTGPVYKSKTSDGNTLTVEFETTGDLKLMSAEQYSDNDSEAIREEYGIDTTKPQEFEIAGDDNVYYRAEATLNGNKVTLTSDKVSAPVNFRYGYTGRGGKVYVECPNLTDDTNLPALVTSTAYGTSGDTPVTENKQYIHISFDDTYVCLKNIIDNADTYTSIFDEETFGFLKNMHDTYGAVFTLNCFNKSKTATDYDISNLPSKFAKDFQDNDGWLKFAFHAEDDNAIYGPASSASGSKLATTEQAVTSYNKFRDAVMTATGNNAASIDCVTRLGFFSGSEENLLAFKELGVKGLFTADDVAKSRSSYYLTDEQKETVNTEGILYDTETGLLFLRSQPRFEVNQKTATDDTPLQTLFTEIESYKNVKVIELFTHEHRVTDKYTDSTIDYENGEYDTYYGKYTMQQLIEEYLKWAVDNGYGFDFPENQYAELLGITPDEPEEPTPEPDKGFAYDKEKETVTCYENGELIIADYDNGVLKNVDVRKVTDENRIFNNIEAINGRKIMFWDSISGMIPLGEAVTVTNGSTPVQTAEPTTEPTTKPTAEPTAQPTPEHSSSLYAVYTLDGTADGEISRVKIASGDAGDEVIIPESAFAARKFTDADGLYDIYSCTPLTDNKVTLKEGDNTVYITVKHEDGKYYYWEDFESYEAGDIPTDNQWYHGGAGTKSGFMNCTTDTINTTTAARWYSSNTSAARNKSFSIFSGTPKIPEGEKLVFSADFRMSATRNKDYRTSLSFGNGADTVMLMSVANSITMTVNDSDTVIPPSVSGTKEETGGDGTAFTKWLNVKIEIDPAKTENNTTVTLTSLTDGDKFTVNGTELESYSYTTTSSVNAVTQMSVNLCKGYRGAVVADNIKLYNTQSEYLTPAKNELAQAIAIYGDIDKSIYEDNGISAYDTAVTNANNVLANSISTNKAANDAKTALINAASSLRLKSERNGERTVINENPDWIFIKEKNYQSEVSEITDSAPDELLLSGWANVDVPHTWNAYDGSDGGGDYDTCKSWYRKNMYIDSAYEGKKLYLEFDGSSIRTELYINGVHVPFSYDNPFGTANSDGVEYEHKGGFNTFRFDITDYVKYGESNTVAVSVDNRIKADTLPLSGDYSREGGIYRDVSLIVTNLVHIDMLDDGSAGLYLTPEKKTAVTDDENKDFTLTAAAKIVNDSDEDRTVKIEASLCEPDHFDIPDNKYIKEHLRFNPEDMYTEGGKTVGEFEAKTVTIKAGESYDYTDTIDVTSPKLWDGLESPYRYEVKLKVTADGTEAESVTETVGFRYFRAPNPEGINKGGSFYLNGRQYPIEGVGKHQDWGKEDGALGIATTEKEMLSDVGTIYELGANGVRLVHYQHSLDEIELYDKLGITVWSEPALCSAMTNADADAYPAFEKATLYQLSAMIKQQYNKPCMLFWGFSNEITHEWDDNLKQIAAQEKKFTSAPALFLKMQNLAKSLDPVRLTTYAANTRRHYDDLYTDITGSNIYPYWYVTRTAASVAKNDYESLQKWITDGTTKPIAVSEYGGAAIVGNTYEYNADGTVDFLGTSAESNTTYQAYLHEKVYKEFTTSANAYWGKYVWQMFDSASDGKTDGTMLGINTKGLVSYDHTTRKDAYYFYKANWNDFEPFAYVVNASRTQRPDPTTIIRAYTNMDLCQLYVNGEKYGEPITDTNENDKVSDGVHVFMWYDVPLTGGDDKIEVRGIKDGKETCSSLDTNGEITFKTMFDGTSIKSNDTSKLIINGSDAVMQCMAKDAPAVSEIADLVTILSTSNISVIMPDGTAVTSGKLSEGMKIRVTAADSTHKDYTVKVDDITNDAVITATEGDASILIDGNTSASWNGGASSSVTIDLDEEYNLNAVDMYSVGEISYTAQVSSDGTSYTAATVTDGKFAADTSGRYVKLTFINAAQVSEINIYGWRFDNIGNYRIDGKNIYLSTSSEHDTDELMTNLLLVGQATYDFVLEEATRVLSDGAILQVTEKYGDTVDYTIKISD